MRCLELCVENPDDVEDWDVAFAYEAIARALAGLGKLRDARRQHRVAADRGAAIVDEEDRKVFLEEFARDPGSVCKRSGPSVASRNSSVPRFALERL